MNLIRDNSDAHFLFLSKGPQDGPVKGWTTLEELNKCESPPRPATTAQQETAAKQGYLIFAIKTKPWSYGDALPMS